MNPRKHIYYITVSDVQNVAKEIGGRRLSDSELKNVVDKLLDRIQWLEPLEYVIYTETSS
ncbi:MAG: hypothetical protein FJ215_09535 [Ignavibacteria bacterium]|nr:hypothetical protein [Ignavibacteria bacterium]